MSEDLFRTTLAETIARHVALGISTSGGSPIHVNVPSTSMARVQEVHRTLLHVLCDLVERAFN